MAILGTIDAHVSVEVASAVEALDLAHSVAGNFVQCRLTLGHILRVVDQEPERHLDFALVIAVSDRFLNCPAKDQVRVDRHRLFVFRDVLRQAARRIKFSINGVLQLRILHIRVDAEDPVALIVLLIIHALVDGVAPNQ